MLACKQRNNLMQPKASYTLLLVCAINSPTSTLSDLSYFLSGLNLIRSSSRGSPKVYIIGGSGSTGNYCLETILWGEFSKINNNDCGKV
jgi:hypothetical protein